MSIKTEAAVEELYHVPENDKAEIVDGELRAMSPTEDLPNRAAGEFFVSLRTRADEKAISGLFTVPWANLAPSAEDIDEACREMWRNFQRDDV